MEVASWVQAISTIVLVLITAYYAYFTKKLVQESSNALIVIKKVDLRRNQLEGCLIEAANYGPGHALNIEVQIEMNSLKRIWENRPTRTELVKAVGPRVLTANNEGRYEIKDGPYALPEEGVVIVSYQTQTGKRSRYKWKFTLSSGELTFLGED